MLLLSFLRLRATFLGLCLFSSVSLCLCGSNSFAALDAETKKPYQVTVVLHIAEHRLLTPVFRDRVEREIHDGLQAALGDLAEVKVVRDHPKLPEVLEKGLRSLDGWNDRTPVKTHFVLIDFSGVNYELEARQYDGQTGTATPVVRQEKIQDREFVGRTAVLMIERDFGITATFQTWPSARTKPQKVQLEFKGGGLDAPLNRWVRTGDVFAVVAVSTGNGLGRVVPDAIVQVETPPAEGTATCDGNLFWRREPPSGAGIAGYRCVKLGATRGPLQMRLVQVKKDGSPDELLSEPVLMVRRHGFSGEKDTLLELKSRYKNISFDTTKLGDKGQFDGVAFVTVMLGGEPKAEIPVVLLDDQQVVVPISLAEKDTTVDYRKRSWFDDVLNSYAVQAYTFTELQKLSAKKDTPRADLVALAKEGARRSGEDLQRLMQERKELFGNGQVATPADRRDLAQADQRIKAIREGAESLKAFAERQAEIDREENSPERKKIAEEIERGKLLERDGELGQAIEVYEKILAGGFKSDELEARVKKLHAVWDAKGPEHEKARKYIYEVFPKLDTVGLQMQLDEANKALDECLKVGDTITPQKMYKVIQIHSARLLKEGEALQDKVSEDDIKQFKMIRELGAELEKMDAKIKTLLEKAPK